MDDLGLFGRVTTLFHGNSRNFNGIASLSLGCELLTPDPLGGIRVASPEIPCVLIDSGSAVLPEVLFEIPSPPRTGQMRHIVRIGGVSPAKIFFESISTGVSAMIMDDIGDAVTMLWTGSSWSIMVGISAQMV